MNTTYMQGNPTAPGHYVFPPSQRIEEGNEVTLLESAFPEEDRGYFRLIATANLEDTIRRANSIAKGLDEERLSPIQIPPLTGYERRVSPLHYRCVSRAIDRLKQRDCELIRFFQRYFPVHGLPPPPFLNEEMSVFQKAEAIREQIRTNPYSLTTWKREGKPLFKRMPPQLVGFTMTEEIRLELFLHGSSWGSFVLSDPWYFDLLAALLETGKFDFLFEEGASAFSSEQREEIQKRLEDILTYAVVRDRTTTVKILLERIGGKVSACYLNYLLQNVANKENTELVELLQRQYEKASCFDRHWKCFFLPYFIFCCCCAAYVYCTERKKKMVFDHDSWEKHHVYRVISPPQLRLASEEKLKELDQRIVRFFEYYAKEHYIHLSAMKEGDEAAKARLLRQEVRRQNYIFTGDDLRCYGRNLPPEIAFFRMTFEAFNLLIQSSEIKKEGEEETLFGLIESGKLEFFYPSLPPHVPSLLKEYLLKAVKCGRIPSIEILLRVLGRNLTRADLRKCRNATQNREVLSLLEKASPLCIF